jgi:hypothetical protein
MAGPVELGAVEQVADLDERGGREHRGAEHSLFGGDVVRLRVAVVPVAGYGAKRAVHAVTSAAVAADVGRDASFRTSGDASRPDPRDVSRSPGAADASRSSATGAAHPARAAGDGSPV